MTPFFVKLILRKYLIGCADISGEFAKTIIFFASLSEYSKAGGK